VSLVIGVDGGGSRTRAAAFEFDAAAGLRMLASAETAGCNPYSVGWEAAQRALAAAIAEASAATHLRPDAAVLAVAGCATDEARQRLADWAQRQAMARRVAVVPDTAPLLAAAPEGTPAVGLIAGTGSSAVARARDGATQIVGGWGYLIDDAGSGFAIGRDALRRLARLADAGAPADALGAALLRHAEVAQPAELKAALYSAANPRAWIAALAPSVLELSAGGDLIARRIVDENVEGLVRLTIDAAARVAATAAERPHVYFAGSLLTRSDHYATLVRDALVAGGWARFSIADAVDGATGCVMLAAKLVTPG